VIRHVVTGRLRLGLTVDALVDRAALAAANGADVVQVRERDLSDGELVVVVRRIVAALRGGPARVFVNDRADIAVAAGASGVHLRGDAPAASRTRAAFGGLAIGRSVHSMDEIDAAVADGGCDYLMFGTVFASAGKPAGHRVAGLDGLRAACRRSPLPVIAIGGITADRVSEIAETGAAGVAGISGFM
jgi:thiamine-phosphate pyrophosphorylase